MSEPVIIHLLRPIFGGGVLTERKVNHEKVFSENIQGKNYRELAKEFATTHASNVKRVEGLDESSEEEISVARKKAKTE